MMLTQKGRSMVEMIGVLAIIGVLSVGAIAGYATAMRKHKINQCSHAVTYLLNTLIQMKSSFPTSTTQNTYYGDILKNMNLLPDGIQYVSNTMLRDKYFRLNMNALYYSTGKYGLLEIHFGENADHLVDICRNLIYTIKENHYNLNSIQSLKTSVNNTVRTTYYGDSGCKEDNKCLSRIDISDIETLCLGCVGYSNCKLAVTY